MHKFPEPEKDYEYRPAIHFTARENWLNDPNGMVYIDGKYHLFYQHYPLAPHWGPMHWGHAVSEDLLHWEHLPIALYPDEFGCIYSGSCVYDARNLSGFGTEGAPPLLAIFTHHSMNESPTEQQSLAYSTDYKHFEKYYQNPVIPNPGQKDFRDPKVFWNPVRKCYSCVVAAGGKVEFYASGNLREWEKTGEFQAGVHGLSGTCECPDCFPLPTADGEKWVLIISMILPREAIGKSNDVYDRMGHITQYYVGTFDGDAFRDTQESPLPLLLDFGTDNYAAVTFQNLEEKVMIGWADNWYYANFTPCAASGFRGKMTLARKMSLASTAKGHRLRFSFEGLEGLRACAYPLVDGANRIRSRSFGLKVAVDGPGEILIQNSQREKLLIKVTDSEIILDRTDAGQKEFSEVYALPAYCCTHAPRLLSGSASEMEIILDKCLLEVLADDGLVPITVSVYPRRPYETISVSGALRAACYIF